MSRRSAMALVATTAALAGGTLLAPSAAQAAAPCPSRIDYQLLGSNMYGASWVEDAVLIASDAKYCKYQGTQYNANSLTGQTWTSGTTYFSIRR